MLASACVLALASGFGILHIRAYIHLQTLRRKLVLHNAGSTFFHCFIYCYSVLRVVLDRWTPFLSIDAGRADFHLNISRTATTFGLEMSHEQLSEHVPSHLHKVPLSCTLVILISDHLAL